MPAALLRFDRKLVVVVAAGGRGRRVHCIALGLGSTIKIKLATGS